MRKKRENEYIKPFCCKSLPIFIIQGLSSLRNVMSISKLFIAETFPNNEP